MWIKVREVKIIIIKISHEIVSNHSLCIGFKASRCAYVCMRPPGEFLFVNTQRD